MRVEADLRAALGPPADGGRHYAGTNTQFVVQYLRERTPSGTLERVFERAGERRTPDELMDVVTWSTYGQFRRLLEAVDAELGTGALHEIGLNTFAEVSVPESTAMLQAFGSPDALYADIGPAADTLAPAVEMTGEGAGAREWVMTQRFRPGLEPFPAYCHYSMGLLAVTPRLFGYPPATVVEEACQCEGAPACRFRVTWDDVSEETRLIGHLETKVRVLEGSLESLHQTVGDLVSGEDLEQVLDRILTSAARAVRAPQFVLALDGDLFPHRRVHADGLGADEAKAIAAALLRGERTTDSSCLVVDLASRHSTYGKLAALNPSGGFYGHELATLDGYGRLAAAALDAAAALEESRSQATRAEALLSLSAALAETASTADMAQRIAEAVPLVIDCDRAIVFLVDSPTSGRIVGLAGYSEPLATELRGRVAPVKNEVVFRVSVRPAAGEPATDASQEFMMWTGTEGAATFPIVSDGAVLGYIVASVTDRPGRLTECVDLDARLRGLAGQAATALRNAALLDQVRRQALHDELTGLPNRTLILDRAEQMLARARRGRRSPAAFFIDLDNFKTVNDTLGHGAGDQLLQVVADRLASVMRANDTVGRLGGDEFIVLADDLAEERDADTVAARIAEALRPPIELVGVSGVAITTSASIGIATGVRSTAEELLRDADVALYRAKAAGKSCAVTFESYMQSEVSDRAQLEVDLRARLCDDFFLDYQPVYDLATRQMTGVEALLRWRHPRRGVLPPGVFIPILEETDLIVTAGRWVLREACQQVARWHRAGHRLDVSVNVSARQLEVDQLVHDVAGALADSGLDPASLVLEVTETALMRDVDAAADRLRQLKGLGVRVAIDDFGTGYSSLAYVQRFPMDVLKIDRSFVSGIAETDRALAMVRALIELARAIGLACVAEGIEDADQLELLRAAGVGSGQGYFLARPTDPTTIDDLLAAPPA